MVAGGTALPGAALLALAVAPLVIGLGYGPITPASSHILARTAPPSRMALTFSIKQTGVPAGAALAGAVLPDPRAADRLARRVRAGRRAGHRRSRWRRRSCARRSTPDECRRRRRRSPASSRRCATRPAHAGAAPSSSIVGFVYAALQVCLMSFLVVYLTESLGYSLVAAGLRADRREPRRDRRPDRCGARVADLARRAARAARADRRRPPGRARGRRPPSARAGRSRRSSRVCVVFGATAIGWNGVQLAEVARHAPAGRGGRDHRRVGLRHLRRRLIGPPAFALIAALTGGYRAGFAAVRRRCRDRRAASWLLASTLARK